MAGYMDLVIIGLSMAEVTHQGRLEILKKVLKAKTNSSIIIYYNLKKSSITESKKTKTKKNLMIMGVSLMLHQS